MALPASGSMSLSQIKTELGSTNNSLRTFFGEVALTSETRMSNFYGYTHNSIVVDLRDGLYIEKYTEQIQVMIAFGFSVTPYPNNFIDIRYNFDNDTLWRSTGYSITGGSTSVVQKYDTQIDYPPGPTYMNIEITGVNSGFVIDPTYGTYRLWISLS